MKKNKTLNIILICLVATVAVAFGICKLVIPEQTQLFLDWAWLNLNKPLPVVGLSALTVGIILWRLFASTSFGKKQINELKELVMTVIEAIKELKAARESDRIEMKNEIKLLRQENEDLRNYIDNVKLANPCKKVREITYERTEETHD